MSPIRNKLALSLLFTATLFSQFFIQNAVAAAATKDWTVLVYVNGNNNLDEYGTTNIKQMETVGSTDNINVVVQWASYSAHDVKRLYIQKSTDPSNVTSPVVQDLGPNVDMGDWNTFAQFIQWGAQNYPANHYLVDMWDHGSGWHSITAEFVGGHVYRPMDVSWDDYTGNSITTVQLGQALAAGAQTIGHKIDIYANDACMMAMAEVAGEVKDSVAYYGGSEEEEPGAGWPYDQILGRWVSSAASDPRDVATIITQEYTKSYQNGSNGSSEVTYAAFDLSKIDELYSALSTLGATFQGLDSSAKANLVTAIGNTQKFTDNDYGDLADFLAKANGTQTLTRDAQSASQAVTAALSDFIVAHAETATYANAHGVSIWLPTTDTYSQYSSLYATLKFEAATHWSETLQSVIGSSVRGSSVTR
jgi:Clostripain family